VARRGSYAREGARIGPLTRAVAGLLGAATFGAGVAAVFATSNGTGSAALLTIGALFIAFSALGDRLQSVEFGGVNLTIRDIARQTFALADEADRLGDEPRAERLRAVGKALEELATRYGRLRRAMPAGGDRTRALETVMTDAGRLATTGAFNAGDVSMWFEEGSAGARVTALALMEGNPELRDFHAMLDAIEDSRSAFEQYHGLRLAEMVVFDSESAAQLSDSDRVELAAVIKRALRSVRSRVSSGLSRDPERRIIGERILKELNAHE
jgi:hypothetical protein